MVPTAFLPDWRTTLGPVGAQTSILSLRIVLRSGVHPRRRKLFFRPAVPGSTLLAWARSREPVKRTPLLMRNRQDNSMTLVFLERDNVWKSFNGGLSDHSRA